MEFHKILSSAPLHCSWEPIRLGRTDGQTDGRRDPIFCSRYLITTPSGFDNLKKLTFVKAILYHTFVRTDD